MYYRLQKVVARIRQWVKHGSKNQTTVTA